LHSTGDASPPAALLLAQIPPVFSVVAPCPRGGAPNAAAALGTRGASPVSVRPPTFTTGCYGVETDPNPKSVSLRPPDSKAPGAGARICSSTARPALLSLGRSRT